MGGKYMIDRSSNGEIIWAEVGERLGLTVSVMRTIRTEFGPILGIEGRTVSENQLPIIQEIASLLKDGLSAEQIVERVKSSSVSDWTEQVLSRMEQASAVSLPDMTLDNKRDTSFI